MLTRDDATTRVARGAAHLDQVRPGWFHQINIGTLEMYCGGRCIVGQLTFNNESDYHFDNGCARLGIQSVEAYKYGFDLSPLEWMADVDANACRFGNWRLLQDAWISAIADRVLAAAQAHRAPPSVNAVREETEQPFVPLRV